MKSIFCVWFYQYIHLCSGGNELLFLFIYHLAISGKYHRAYITAISISFSFIVVNSMIVFYQQPRPYWVDQPKDHIIKAYAEIYTFGNPASDTIPAVIFVIVLYKFNKTYWVFVYGFFWIMATAMASLMLGINSLSQVLYGIQLGVIFGYTIIFIIDKNELVTNHFRRIIRGR